MRALPLLFGLLAVAAASPAITIKCNATLEAGSTLQLTDKLDLSGRDPAPDLPWPCGIVGPEASEDGGDPEPATIIVPDNDCVLVAQGLVTLRGHLRFLVGKKNRKFDCCRDGEAHGSILCTDTNVTFAEGSVVTVETKDDSVVVNPGGFWTGGFINVHGVVNAYGVNDGCQSRQRG